MAGSRRYLERYAGGRVHRAMRRTIPSLVGASRHPSIFLPGRLVDRFLASRNPALAALPPPHLRFRVGADRWLFNHIAYRFGTWPQWIFCLSQGWITMESTIVELGSGAGSGSIPLARYDFFGHRFTGRYVGIDVDPELVAWCNASTPPNFEFHRVDVRSSVYNPSGADSEPFRIPLADGEADFVRSGSLFTHLLERDVHDYLAESRRVLRSGGYAFHTTFCLDDLENAGLLGGRWTFRHELGAARVEHPAKPEAAVAYRRDWLLEAARDAGFSEVALWPHVHSALVCRV